MKTNNLTTKRFVIRKSLLGTSTVITFTNKKDQTFTYDHDEIYSTFQENRTNEFIYIKIFLSKGRP